MTAAEEVLAWLLIEKLSCPDDVSYSPDQAQEIIVLHLDQAKGHDRINTPKDVIDVADGIFSDLDIASTDDRIAVLSEALRAERERCALILESMLINTDASAVERARNRHYAKMIRDGSPASRPHPEAEG